jgi:5-deoxy-glucuronate isomerase
MSASGALARRHRLPETPGVHVADDEHLEALGFALVRVAAGGAPARLHAPDRETLVVILENAGGTVTVDGERFTPPDRASVFDDPPSAIYAPPGAEIVVEGAVLAGAFTAPAAAADAPAAYLVGPDDVTTVQRGTGNFARAVRDILPADRPAVRLLVGETINPAGNWSSSPPHKHDVHDPPRQARLEEIYLFRVDPAQGFGLQLSYRTDPEPADHAFAVADLDVSTIPSGYHPVVAGPGYRLYYLWGLAGEGRTLHWSADPAHAWVEGA